jgi:phosphohistidine phosphatase SixA
VQLQDAGRVMRALAFLALAFAFATPASASEALWGELRSGGLIVMIRHAQTEPGLGDPPNFKLGDCSTQRNLSAAGRDDARRLGEAVRRERVRVAEVRSSEWCRCRETAELAFGRYAPWPPLNSFFGDRGSEPVQTQEILALGARVPRRANIVLVTHQVNITAVSGLSPAAGEMVILKPAGAGQLEVVGRIRLD